MVSVFVYVLFPFLNKGRNLIYNCPNETYPMYLLIYIEDKISQMVELWTYIPSYIFKMTLNSLMSCHDFMPWLWSDLIWLFPNRSTSTMLTRSSASPLKIAVAAVTYGTIGYIFYLSILIIRIWGKKRIRINAQKDPCDSNFLVR